VLRLTGGALPQGSGKGYDEANGRTANRWLVPQFAGRVGHGVRLRPSSRPGGAHEGPSDVIGRARACRDVTSRQQRSVVATGRPGSLSGSTILFKCTLYLIEDLFLASEVPFTILLLSKAYPH
jgi:hypothetical protein